MRRALVPAPGLSGALSVACAQHVADCCSNHEGSDYGEQSILS